MAPRRALDGQRCVQDALKTRSDAFKTATGVHAAAIIKAQRLGYAGLADLIYSGVPAHTFGLRQEIEIGRMSGKSNVIFWLEQRGYRADNTLVEKILEAAHKSPAVLSDTELTPLIDDHFKHA